MQALCVFADRHFHPNRTCRVSGHKVVLTISDRDYYLEAETRLPHDHATGLARLMTNASGAYYSTAPSLWGDGESSNWHLDHSKNPVLREFSPVKCGFDGGKFDK